MVETIHATYPADNNSNAAIFASSASSLDALNTTSDKNGNNFRCDHTSCLPNPTQPVVAKSECRSLGMRYILPPGCESFEQPVYPSDYTTSPATNAAISTTRHPPHAYTISAASFMHTLHTSPLPTPRKPFLTSNVLVPKTLRGPNPHGWLDTNSTTS